MAGDTAKCLFVPARKKARLELAGLPHRHPAVELMFLGQIADARPGLRRERLNVIAQDAALAPRGPQQPQQHPYGRGFSRAVAAQKCEHAPARHFQAQIIDRRPAADSRRPSRASSEYARATVFGLSTSLSASDRTLGNWSPTSNRPRPTASLTCSAICR